ncbi:MAG: glycosyltransferase family 2 protein [Hyphomicrobiales bacterium]|nr:glycosyltransferase family 2 protein [Hyphomicrobiales bacterium]
MALSNPLAGIDSLTRFSPEFYLNKYDDVLASGIDPWAHYKAHGWKEGRDPSPLFSTSFYVENAKFVPGAAAEPLSHYLSAGKAAGAPPHPLFRDIEVEKIHVGIVTVAFNCSDIARLTVQSVGAARSNVQITYYLIDGGSNEAEKQKLRTFCEAAAFANFRLEFVDLDENLGYSGSNNVGIRRALDEGCSHVCLLNPDVVVTDYWLERMLAHGEPFISPVCNSVGNEQTVPCDYQIERTPDCFPVVNEFARKWNAAFAQANVTTDFVGFFCALIRREIFEAIGLLDERFHPGGYEDLDFCLRARQAGVDLWVARHVYLHHWGSASFSNLPMVDRIAHADANRKRYEEKHGDAWIDWKQTIYRSATLDLQRARRNPPRAIRAFQDRIIRKHRQACDQLAKEIGADTLRTLQTLENKDKTIERARRLANNLEEQRAELLKIIRKLDPGYTFPGRLTSTSSFEAVTCNSTFQQPAYIDGPPTVFNILYSELFYVAARELVLERRPESWAMKFLLPAIETIAKLGSRPSVIFANGVDPIEGNEKDGFVQRVLAIDELFKSGPRIYVRVKPNSADAYRITHYALRRRHRSFRPVRLGPRLQRASHGDHEIRKDCLHAQRIADGRRAHPRGHRGARRQENYRHARSGPGRIRDA